MDFLYGWSPPLPEGHPWYMDRRHVVAVRAELATRRWRRVLEVGCHHGYSTSAFLDALRCGDVQEVHLCDPAPTPQLLELVQWYGVRAEVHALSSLELLRADADWDLALVDGDHSLGHAKREAPLLLGIPGLFLHDTRYDVGPAYTMRWLQARGYAVVEDAERREGERTERGLAWLTSRA